MLDAQVKAREISQRLRNPANGKNSSELEIVSETFARRERSRVVAEKRRIDDEARAEANRERLLVAREAAIAEISRIYEEQKEARRATMIDAPPRRPPIGLIIEVVSRQYGVSELDIRSHRRTGPLVIPRHICMYFARHLTEWSFPRIGENLGGRDHTTVLYAVDKISQRIASDAAFAAEIEEIREQIMGRNTL